MIEITQNFYQVKSKEAVHRWFSALFLIVVLWLGAVGQVNAQRTVTFSGPIANYVTGATGVTVSTTGTDNSKTISCVQSTPQNYLTLGGNAINLQFGLTDANEKITAINIVWLSNTTNQTIPIVYGQTLTATASNVSGTNAGYVAPATIATSATNNCPGETFTFPTTAPVKQIWISRALMIANVNGTANTTYASFDSKITTSTSTGYTTSVGKGSTAYIGSITLTIESLTPTITLTSVAGTNAQTVPVNSSITNVAYTIGGTATAAGTNIAWGSGNVPAGITFNKSANPVTISGTPTVQGNYSYTITTDGSPAATATGTITVNPADVNPPALQSSIPSNTASGVALSGNITLAFDEKVTLADGNKITLTGGTGSLTTTGVADSTTLTIPYSGLASNTTYTLTINSGAINDMSGNPYAGTTLTFTTLTPAPVINLTSAAATTSQFVKGGVAITPITYTFTNADAGTPYALTGTLPTGVTANYAGGMLTISGTATAAVYPATNTYTITATPLAGYTGSPVTASGSIVVKDPNAKKVAFLYTGGSLPEGANKLYTMLNTNYDVTAIQSTGNGAATDFDAAYAGHDLVVLHESVGSSNLAAQKLGTKIGTLPVLNTKVHMYGKANWPTGAGQNGAAGDTYINVNSAFQAHPIFGGVTMTGGQVIMANTNGIIRYATGVAATSNIATNKSGTAANVSVLEINNQSATDANKYMLVPFAAANEDLTDNGLLLFKNACDYLMSSNVYIAPTTWTTAWSNGTPSATVEAIIDGVYSGAGFVAKKLTVNSGKSLTITSGNLTVQNEVINNGSLVLENNANLIQVNNVANTGNVTVKRNSNSLKRLDYTMWSSPVSGTQTLAGFSPLTSQSPNRFYIYNSSNNKYAEVTPTNNFAQGTGYLIRMPNEDPANLGGDSPYVLSGVAITYNGVFTGVPNNGAVSLNGLTVGQYVAVGNPYPSTISANAFIDANADVPANGVLYYWRKTNNTNQGASPTTSYATYTKAGGVANDGFTPGADIAVGQGFITTVPSSGTIAFTNAMRSSSNSAQFLRTKVTNKDRVWLNLSAGTSPVNQMMVAYMDGATQGVDAGIDGKYINDSALALTSNINGDEYVIQGRPAFDASDVVPLNFKTDTAGDYTIAIDHADGVFATGQDVYLVDSTTGSETNLKSGNYTFTAYAGTANSRFSLKYQKILGVNDAVYNENSVTVYKNKGVITVNSGAAAIAGVKVYDIQGKLLAELKDVNTSSAVVSGLKASNQVLIVQVALEGGVLVTKKAVN